VNYFNFTSRHDKNSDNFTDVTLQHRISVFNKYQFERKNNRQANIAMRYIYEDRWGVICAGIKPSRWRQPLR